MGGEWFRAWRLFSLHPVNRFRVSKISCKIYGVYGGMQELCEQVLPNSDPPYISKKEEQEPLTKIYQKGVY